MRLHEEKKKLRQKNTQKRLEKQASDMAHKATSNASMGMAALLSQVCSIWEVEVDERDKDQIVNQSVPARIRGK